MGHSDLLGCTIIGGRSMVYFRVIASCGINTILKLVRVQFDELLKGGQLAGSMSAWITPALTSIRSLPHCSKHDICNFFSTSKIVGPIFFPHQIYNFPTNVYNFLLQKRYHFPTKICEKGTIFQEKYAKFLLKLMFFSICSTLPFTSFNLKLKLIGQWAGALR